MFGFKKLEEKKEENRVQNVRRKKAKENRNIQSSIFTGCFIYLFSYGKQKKKPRVSLERKNPFLLSKNSLFELFLYYTSFFLFFFLSLLSFLVPLEHKSIFSKFFFLINFLKIFSLLILWLCSNVW